MRYMKSVNVFPMVVDTTGQWRIGINFNGKPGGVDNTGWLGYTDTGAFSYPPVQNAGQWVPFFHSCRLALVKVKFIPASNTAWDDKAAAVGADATLLPWLEPISWIQDNDGFDFAFTATHPTDEQTQRQERVKTRYTYKPWKILFRPNKQPIQPKYPTVEGNTQTNSSNQAGLWHGSGSACGTFATANGFHVCGVYNGSVTSQSRRGGLFVVTSYWMFKDMITG